VHDGQRHCDFNWCQGSSLTLSESAGAPHHRLGHGNADLRAHLKHQASLLVVVLDIIHVATRCLDHDALDDAMRAMKRQPSGEAGRLRDGHRERDASLPKVGNGNVVVKLNASCLAWSVHGAIGNEELRLLRNMNIVCQAIMLDEVELLRIDTL